MERFYSYLSDGLGKDLALQKAKTDFLAQANQLKAHPYFWASYVIIGNTDPIELDEFNENLLIILSAGFLVVLLVFLFKVYRKRLKMQ